MAQRLLFDRPARLAYLGLALAGLACRGAPGSVVPASAQPVSREQVAEWVRGTQPAEHRLHRFKWLFRDDKSSAGGRGSARIAPPDSMRFDVAGPFGSGAASAAVVGEQPLWAEPPDAIEKMVPNYPLMWGMFGVARLPEAGAELRGPRRWTGHRVAVRRGRRHHRVRAHPGPPHEDADRGPPGRRAPRAGRSDARLGRRSAHRETHGAECPGPARPHLPLDFAGRLCA